MKAQDFASVFSDFGILTSSATRKLNCAEALEDHGNQNTRFWARAALARMANDDFKSDKHAWNRWWVGEGHDPIAPEFLKPYTPPAENEKPKAE
jgi:hypothetical protein